MNASLARPALFLDRDGVLNAEVEYLCRPEEAVLLPGVAHAIRELNGWGVPVIVVSNQSGLGRGLFTEHDLHEVERELSRQLSQSGATISAWYYCPYHPDFSDRYTLAAADRKPEPGMLLRAAREHVLHLGRSILVGDKVSDLEAAARAGCRSILVRTGYGANTEAALAARPDLARPLLGIFDHLLEALPLLCAELAESG